MLFYFCFFYFCFFWNLPMSQSNVAKGKHTTMAQKQTVVEWLEIRKNFQLITGSSAQGTNVSQKPHRKSDAYSQLAEHMNLLHKANWDAKMAKNRYELILKKYKVLFIIQYLFVGDKI